MKKMMIGIGLVAVVITGVVVYLFSNLGLIIKSAIEEYGSQVAGVRVTVGSVDIEFDKGVAMINTFSLGNPPGFSAPGAFDMDRIRVTLAPGWETGDKIIIDEILVNQPKITYELGSNGSNFDVLKANLKKTAGSKTEPSQDSGTEPSIIINHLRIQNGEVAATATILGGKTLSVSLPDLHLTDIGKDTGGSNPDEIARKILHAIESSVTSAVTRIDLGVVGDAAKAAEKKIDAISKDIGSRTGQVVEDAGAAADTLGDTLGKNLDDAGDAVKSLFGN